MLVLATRLVLLCHAATRSMRDGAFPDPNEAIDDVGRTKAEAVKIRPAPDRVVSAPSIAARQTAEALGLAAEIEPALADMDWGAWAGRGLHETDPEALVGWMQNPASGAPGGETFESVQRRVATWIDAQAATDTRILAITHQNVLRAALAYVLDIPPDAAFRIDIPPLARLTLSFNRVWRLQGLDTDA